MLKSEKLEKNIAAAEEEIRKLKAQQKQLQQKHSDELRKERTRRLIQRGALLESMIEDAAEFTNEQVKIFLEKTIKTNFAYKTLAQLKEQPIAETPNQQDVNNGVEGEKPEITEKTPETEEVPS